MKAKVIESKCNRLEIKHYSETQTQKLNTLFKPNNQGLKIFPSNNNVQHKATLSLEFNIIISRVLYYINMKMIIY